MNELSVVLINAVLLFGIWWLYFVEHKNYLIDLTRQRLFDARDELFERAAKGAVPIDSRAYKMTRTTLNGMIRFTHDLSLVRFFVIVLFQSSKEYKAIVKKYDTERSEALASLSKSARKIIIDTQVDMHLAILSHLVRGSVILLMMLLPFIIILRAFHLWTRLWKLLAIRLFRFPNSKKTLSAVDAEANSIGSDSVCVL